MRNLLKAAIKLIERLERVTVIVAFSVMVAVIALNVLLRYVFHCSLIWGQDVALICFMWTTFLGASIGAKRRMLIRVDSLLRFMSPRAARFVQLFIDLTIACFLVLLFKAGLDLVIFNLPSTIPSMVHVSMSVYSTSILVATVFMIPHYVSDIVAAIKSLASHTNSSQDETR
ncbi:TRAP transporter small permease [Candidatus Fermentibacteria bacterium]|nr:TRAP transporter small permease [Candidatus Fermentibacteria bacterium]